MYTTYVEYEDFNGNQHKDKLAFNMNEIELMRWISSPEFKSMNTGLQKISEAAPDAMISITESLIRNSYGKLSDDGMRFTKSKETWDAFRESNAYPKFFIELASNPDTVNKFLEEALPKNLKETIEVLSNAASQKVSETPSA